jgi:hypothetical protein
MKRLIALFALLSLACFIGCSDNDKSPTDNGDQTPEYDGTLTASVTGDLGLEFDCSEAYGLAVPGEGGDTGLMQIQGTITQSGHEYMIDIQVYHDPATDTFDFVFPPADCVASIAEDNTGNFSNAGSVTFTTVSADRLVGTFSFHAFRALGGGGLSSIDVADGSFDVPVIDIAK